MRTRWCNMPTCTPLGIPRAGHEMHHAYTYVHICPHTLTSILASTTTLTHEHRSTNTSFDGCTISKPRLSTAACTIRRLYSKDFYPNAETTTPQTVADGSNCLSPKTTSICSTTRARGLYAGLRLGCVRPTPKHNPQNPKTPTF